MGRASMFAVFAFATLAAGCGDNQGGAVVPVADAAPPDAPLLIDAAIADARIANLDCNTDPLPTTAADPVNVGGNAITISAGGASAVEGAAIEVRSFADPDGTPLGMATSDANGDFAIEVDSGGAPVDAFVRATAEGLLPTEVWPPAVIDADQTAPAPLFELGTVNLLATFSGQSLDLDENGIAVVLILDCDQNPIEGAVLTPPDGVGGVVYSAANGLPDSALERTSTSGTAFVFDIPPGADLVFDAEAMGMSLRDNHVRIAAGTVTALAIAPGE